MNPEDDLRTILPKRLLPPTKKACPLVEISMLSSTVEQRLIQLGIVLPQPWQLPPNVTTSASFVRLQGTRLLISGHVPLDDKGKVCGPYGKVGAEVSLEEATIAARRSMLAVLSSVRHALGSLDAISSWSVIRGYVNSAESFNQFPSVLNGASDLLLAIFGLEVGAHARLALGVSGLPFNAAVEIEAELELH